MARRIEFVVLLAIAALCLNAQCFALCLATSCQSAYVRSAKACHHSSHSKNKGSSDCQHRKSDLMATEAGASLKYSPPVQFVPVSSLAAACSALSYEVAFRGAVAPGRGSPPGKPLCFLISVLRI